MAPDTILRRRSSLIEAQVDDDLLGMDVDSGVCYGLNETAAAIWRALEQPLAFGQLIDRLQVEFDVERARCEADTIAVLEELRADGLVKAEASADN